VSWNARNAGTTPENSSLRRCGWPLLEKRPRPKVARELGIRVNQLRQWRLDFEEEERNGVPKKSWPPLNSMLGSFGVRMPSSARRTSFKKSGYLLRGGVEVRYAFIDTERGSHAVRTLCRTLRYRPAGITPPGADHQHPGAASVVTLGGKRPELGYRSAGGVRRPY